MIYALVLMPALAGLAAFTIRTAALRRALLVLAACVHAGLTACVWVFPPQPALQGWLHLDAPGRLFLSITSGLFLVVAVYAAGFLEREGHGKHKDFLEGVPFANAPEAVFTGGLLMFLSTMTLVTASQHFGLLWVAVEATTLASAPLIYFHRHHRSLEATWKYLMLCSVGIALALLGNFFLAIASSGGSGAGPAPMVLDELLLQGPRLQVTWLRAAFLFFLVGYGTKMGLAPLHTWLPDAHSEAPSLVSALLSGALLNCAFLGILRAQQVLAAAGQAAFGQELLVVFGLMSVGFAAIFILHQTDYKRMLAYSSVEHMGIVALGMGLGGAAAFGAMLHALNHSLAKAMLFLVAGNILAAYRTRSTEAVRGLLRTRPVSGVLWVGGFLAITGSPPFGPFLSEFTILKAALDQGHPATAALYLALLALIFVGMATVVLRMAQGPPSIPVPAEARPWRGEAVLAVAPPALLGTAMLLLGLWVPAPLAAALREAARVLGGS